MRSHFFEIMITDYGLIVQIDRDIKKYV